MTMRTTAPKLASLIAGALLLGGCEFAMSNADRIERAEESIAAGDMSAAVVDLKNVLQDEADNSQARLLLAKAELALGDVGAAGVDFGRVDAKAVKPEDYEPVRWQLQLAQREFKSVVEGLAGPRPGLSESQRLTMLARAHGGLGDAASAQRALEEAVQKDPANDEALAALALARAGSGSGEQALKMLNDALAQRPKSAALHRAIGEVNVRLNRLPDAEASFRRALEASSPKADLPGYLYAAGGLSDTLLAQGKVDEAAKLVEQLGKDAPGAGLTLLMKGRVAAAQRDYPVALENLQKLLNADPDNVQVRTLVGGVNLEQGNLEQAAMNLQRALAVSPDFVPARRLLAQVQMAQGRPDAATQTLEASSADGSAASPDLLLMQARAALAAGDQARATRLLEQLEAQGVPTEAARLDLASAFIQVGKPDRALQLLGTSAAGEDDRREQLRLIALTSKDRAEGIRALQDYAAKNAANPRAVQFAALTLGALGQVQTSTALLEKLAAAEPKNVEVQTNLARIQARAGQLDAAEATLKRVLELQPSADVRIALAQLAATRGRDDDAMRYLEQARTSDAKATAPRALLARAYLAKNDLAAAQKVAAELVELQPNQPEPRLLAAAIAVQRKDAAAATQQASEAVRLAPQSAQAWLGKGEIHERLEQREEARAAYRRALALAPQSPLPPAALARVELAAGNADAALAAARAAQKQPENKVAGLQLEGGVLSQLGRHAEAARAFEQAQAAQPTTQGVVAVYAARLRAGATAPEQVLQDWIRSRPNDMAVRAALAEHWQLQKRNDRAVQEYEAALKLDPNNALFLNNLAWLYSEAKDPRALATAKRAYEIAPRNPAIMDTLGWILFNGNEQQEGLRLLREAAAGAAGSVDIQYHFATALSRSGNAAEARKIAERMLAQNLTPEWREKFGALTR
jgi:putative PEP-CTERM system TPR-repeat lipoprotein